MTLGASFSCHPSSPLFVIPVLDTGIQLSIIIKDIAFLNAKFYIYQNFWIPVSEHWDDRNPSNPTMSSQRSSILSFQCSPIWSGRDHNSKSSYSV
ncbi:MAG: hypothetical protein ACR5K9_01165 [Wolbachia sp.]